MLWSQDCFTLLKIIEDSNLLLMWILSIDTIFEIKTEKIRHLYQLIYFKIMTSPLNVSTNNIFLWKVTIYFKTITTTKVVRRVALFYMFSHLFTEWPNRSQMDSYICLSIQFVVILLWLKKVKKILPHTDM